MQSRRRNSADGAPSVPMLFKSNVNRESVCECTLFKAIGNLIRLTFENLPKNEKTSEFVALPPVSVALAVYFCSFSSSVFHIFNWANTKRLCVIDVCAKQQQKQPINPYNRKCTNSSLCISTKVNNCNKTF